MTKALTKTPQTPALVAPEFDSGGDTVLEVEGLTCTIQTPTGPAHLVDNVSFALRRGQTIGVVGESGSGKTMLARAIMGISPKRATVTGRVVLGGVDLMSLPLKERRRRLGSGIGMVFQNPMTSLNPVVTIGRQITEGLRYHHKVGKPDARRRAIELLEQVGISEPETRLKQYPYQLSGGMRQRVIIAAALACDPEVLIADEATTALDVTVQKQILDLIQQIQSDRNMAAIVISHDLGVVAGRTDDIAVMYASKMVEAGSTAEVFREHRHQYTAALFDAIPRLESDIHSRLSTIPGSVRRPAPEDVGCVFATRCKAATQVCTDVTPVRTYQIGETGHWYCCHHPHGVDVDAAGAASGSEAALR